MLDRRGGDLNPLSYSRGLARAAIEAGARVHGRSRVLGMKRQGRGWRLDTAIGSVTAPHVVLATNGYTDRTLAGTAADHGAAFRRDRGERAARRGNEPAILPDRPVLYESGQDHRLLPHRCAASVV